MNFKAIKLFLVIILATNAESSFAKAPKEFPVFDGRVYNGKFYPRIDIIEWGNPSHMEFHIFSKNKPIDLGLKYDNTTGKAVMLVRYHIKERNEFVCRRVLTPGHFNNKFFIYKDNSDKDFDNIIVTAGKLEEEPGEESNTKKTADYPLAKIIEKPLQYEDCKEEDEEEERQPAASENAAAPNAKDAGAKPHVSEKQNTNTEKDSPGSAFTSW